MVTLDVSIYDYSTFDAPCLKANGVERLVVGSSSLAASAQMVKRGRDAGIIVTDLYAFIYYGLGYESRDVDNCLQLASELGGITRIWLDCESGFSDDGVQNDTEAPGISVQYRHMRTREQRFRVEAAGLECGIYTGQFWWPSNMGNTAEFSDLPLWLANYGSNDPNNPRPPITEVNFGGWTTVAAHQYSSSIPVCGRGRDHNYWFEEEESPLKLTEAQTENLLLRLFAGREFVETATREERLARAVAELDKAETSQSVNDVAQSAITLATSGGKLAPGTKFKSTSEVIS
jgi:hypothetical protein